MDRARSSTWWHSHSWLCALHWRTAIAQRCALDYFRLSYRRTSVRHRAFPVLSRSQSDDQELVLVVGLAAVYGDLSPNFSALKSHGVHVCIAGAGAERAEEAGEVMGVQRLVGHDFAGFLRALRAGSGYANM